MKKYLLFLILSLFTSLTKAQIQSVVLQNYFNDFQKAQLSLQAFHEGKKYAEEEQLLLTYIKKLEEVSLSEKEQKDYKNLIRGVKASMNYNLACVCALQNKKKEAIAALEKAVALGYDDYRNVKTDKDLVNIRKEKKFVALLQKLKAFDKLALLQQSGAYQKEQRDTLPHFTYQSATDPSLVQVKN